jgi:hypothetical protein
VGLNLDLRIGTSHTWQLQALNPDDSVPSGVFEDADVLSAAVWQGAADAPLIRLAIAWISSANAQFAISFAPGDTANLASGVYYVEAQATRGTDVADLLPRGTTLTLADTPGTATIRPAYTTLQDLRRIAPWIDDQSGPALLGAESGFVEQLADARDWLDECILRNYRGGNVTLLGFHGMALDSWFTGGTRRTSLRNPFVLNLLKQGPATASPPNGGLIVTSRTKDIVSYYALHRITEGMITRGTQYAALSARALHKAHQLLSSYTAEISVNGAVDYAGSLIANIPVQFSSTNTVRA